MRADRWNGLRAGDPVVVQGVAIRGARWEFRAHVVNLRNGAESIEVVGGRPGDRSIRSFEPERIYAVTAKPGSRRRGNLGVEGPSLADAPQLPLG